MTYAHEAAILKNIAVRQEQAGDKRPSMYSGLYSTYTSSTYSTSGSVSGNPISGAKRPK